MTISITTIVPEAHDFVLGNLEIVKKQLSVLELMEPNQDTTSLKELLETLDSALSIANFYLAQERDQSESKFAKLLKKFKS